MWLVFTQLLRVTIISDSVADDWLTVLRSHVPLDTYRRSWDAVRSQPVCWLSLMDVSSRRRRMGERGDTMTCEGRPRGRAVSTESEMMVTRSSCVNTSHIYVDNSVNSNFSQVVCMCRPPEHAYWEFSKRNSNFLSTVIPDLPRRFSVRSCKLFIDESAQCMRARIFSLVSLPLVLSWHASNSFYLYVSHYLHKNKYTGCANKKQSPRKNSVF